MILELSPVRRVSSNLVRLQEKLMIFEPKPYMTVVDLMLCLNLVCGHTPIIISCTP